MRKIAIYLGAFMLITTLSQCATIVSKSSYEVHIRTEPSNAHITVTDKRGKIVFTGMSPTTVRLKAGAGYFSKAYYEVKLARPGYESKVIPVNYKLNGWYFGNVVFGGLLGLLVIDPLTGAMWRIKDPLVDEVLVRSSVTKASEPTLEILDINKIPSDMKARLVRIE